MKDKKRIFKYIVLSLLIVSTTIVSLPSKAATTPIINMTDKLTLTFSDCIDRALNEDENKYQYQNKTLLKRQKDLEAMRRNYDQAIAMKNLGESLYVNIDSYKSLYASVQTLQQEIDDGTSTTATVLQLAAESAQLDTYNSTYYPLLMGTTPTVAKGDVFGLYIKGYSSAAFDLGSGINSFELSKDVVKNSISQGVRQMYDTLMGLYDTLSLQGKLCEINDKQYRILISSYLNGQTAEIDRINAGIELDKLKINIDILKRNIESLKFRLKQQIGVWPEQEVEFKPYSKDNKIKEPLSYDQYLNVALDKRIEVISARSDVAAKDNMFEITKKYVTDSSNTDWIEAQIAVEEKNAALDDAKKSVEQDVKTGYNDVMEKKENIQVTKQKIDNADVQYQIAKKQYEQGFITESMLWNAEIGCLQTKTAYQKALRDYDTALYRLEQASDFGPQYTIKAGVK